MSEIEKNQIKNWLILVAGLIPVILNICALVWGAATLSADLKHLSVQLMAVQATTVTRQEFEGRMSLLDERDRIHNGQIAELFTQINRGRK